MIDATHLKAHRTASSLRSKGGPDRRRGRLIGRTKYGLDTKLHAVPDGNGEPLRFLLSARQVSDHTGALALLDTLPGADWLLADRGYDADWFREAQPTRASIAASRAARRASGPSSTTDGATSAGTASR